MHHSSLDNFNENNDITTTWTTTIKGKTINTIKTMASALCFKTTNYANYIDLTSALCFINSEFRELS